MNKQSMRPTNIIQVKKSLSFFQSDEGRDAGLAYRPNKEDTFIATYPKCGTTWIQQLVHCLRTRGDTDFGEITDVVPWLEMSYDLGVDNYAPQKATPQCFKSHLSWNEIPKGGRYIHITRNPEAVLLSFYNFFDGWFFETGSITLDEFTEELFLQGTSSGLYWNHIIEWWPQRERPDVLFLCYEKMLENPENLIHTIADFMQIKLDRELLNITLEHSSVSYMRKHVSQFDDHPLKQKLDPVCGLPEGGSSSKVSIPGDKKIKPVISEEMKHKLNQKWQEVITPKIGLESYQALLLS